MRGLSVIVVAIAVASAHAQPGSGSGSGPKIIQVPTDVDAPTVTAAASPSQVKLGERFTLFVTATRAAGIEVNLREPIDVGGGFEVRQKSGGADREDADGRVVREWQIELFAWELGDLEVPPVAVTFTANGRAGQVATNATPVRVVGVLGESDDPKLMRGDAPPVELSSISWVRMVIAVAIVAVLAALVYWRVRARMRRSQIIASASASFPAARNIRIDTPSQRALARLLAIERSGALDRDDDRKQGYADMVDVIREYVGARYRVATLDLTTLELRRALAPVAPTDELARIDAWLERCDIVKYGGYRATSGDAGGVLADARALVLATTSLPSKEAA